MLTKTDKEILRFLQADLPLESRPYADLAHRLNCTEKEIAGCIMRLKENGYIRRMGAILDHYKIGLTANCMCVWNVPPAGVALISRLTVKQPGISHCYVRRRVSGKWPYNFYTMIHGRSRKECMKVIKQIARQSGIADYKILFTLKQLKKISPSYKV
ncbi:MAG: Lrp/AsnC family transcriptional regulator [Candidatus Omnitrophica bacterium]|nr:Lrp/AsnC family transcriptional regulator [Candidatus Omnitrophota bacterium]MBU4479385.1 Lrp/AsnC family transcriptional regulator [Candidatus Omnitrophota bacterium]MCG2703233.1 Lrp/AsnC family transcriptional regulator [Candidatus Omnitrophota bacterium]